MKHVRMLEMKKHKGEITAEFLGVKAGGVCNKQMASQGYLNIAKSRPKFQ